MDPENPFALDPLTAGPLMMKYRKNHLDAMAAALDVIEEVDRKFAAAFGRSYGGAIEEYRCEDADVVIMTIGGMTRHGQGRCGRRPGAGGSGRGSSSCASSGPFPAKRIAKALEGKKALCVIDRSVCFGWSQGPMYMETKAAWRTRRSGCAISPPSAAWAARTSPWRICWASSGTWSG